MKGLNSLIAKMFLVPILIIVLTLLLSICITNRIVLFQYF